MILFMEIISRLCDQEFIIYKSKCFPPLQQVELLSLLQLGFLGKGGAGHCPESLDRLYGSTKKIIMSCITSL